MYERTFLFRQHYKIPKGLRIIKPPPECTPKDKKKKRKLVRKCESITELRENVDGPWRL